MQIQRRNPHLIPRRRKLRHLRMSQHPTLLRSIMRKTQPPHPQIPCTAIRLMTRSRTRTERTSNPLLNPLLAKIATP